MPRNYSILIVEDESAAIDSLISNIQQVKNKYKIIGVARNGKEALKFLKESKPDIVISDIVMPVMDGLSMIAEAVKLSPDTQYVLLSGYDEFEYAKTAINLGVKEYLLKPVSSITLHESLNKICVEIEMRDQTIEYPQLYSALHSPVSSTLVKLLAGKKYMICMLNAGNYHAEFFNDDIYSYYDDLWSKITLPPFKAGEDMHSVQPVLYYGLHSNERYFLIGWEPAIEKPFSDYIQSVFSGFNKKDAHLPISIIYSTLPVEVSSFFRISHTMRELYTSEYVPWHPQIFKLMNSAAVFSRKRVSALNTDMLIACIHAKNQTQARQSLFDMLNSWLSSSVNVGQFYKNLTFVLTSIRHLSSIEDTEWPDFLQEVYTMFSLSNNFEVFFQELWALLLRVFMQDSSNSISSIIWSIRQYMDENFCQPIGIFDIAQQFNISASYLARKYKSTFGQSPINYLISKRLTKAKSLMKQYPDMQIQNISAMVSYQDQHYFSKLFKKYCGISPTDYRDNLLKSK